MFKDDDLKGNLFGTCWVLIEMFLLKKPELDFFIHFLDLYTNIMDPDGLGFFPSGNDYAM